MEMDYPPSDWVVKSNFCRGHLLAKPLPSAARRLPPPALQIKRTRTAYASHLGGPPSAPVGRCPLGWQGHGGSPNCAPRPATPGEVSDARRATQSDPGQPARPTGPANRPGQDIFQLPGPARTFVRIGILR